MFKKKENKMKIMKKSLLALALVSISFNVLPHGNGGAIAAGTIGGLAGGMLIGSAISNREDSGTKSVRREINSVRAEKRRVTKQFNKGNISQDEYNSRMTQLDRQIENLQAAL